MKERQKQTEFGDMSRNSREEEDAQKRNKMKKMCIHSSFDHVSDC